MNKSLILSLILCMLSITQSNAQLGRLMNNVKRSVAKELLNNDGNDSETAPEPSCAREPADVIFNVGKYDINYAECYVDVLEDGSVLLNDTPTHNYYISKNGVTEGPYKEDNAKVTRFKQALQGDENEDIITKYKDYISGKENKYMITFKGKTYGPYTNIGSFAVTKSGDKFVALVGDNPFLTSDEGAKLEEEMKNAKSDIERTQIAMRISKLMEEQLNSTGNFLGATVPKVISNVPNVTKDSLTILGSEFNSSMKYDDILLVSSNTIMDLSGKTLLTFDSSNCSPESMFVFSDNSKYACYKYGTLTFSDGSTLSELFSPHLVKHDGKVSLAYMYYSPKRKSIMQSEIPF
jgi:hypothetical protein